MKKIISLFIIIIFMFPLLFINTKASNNDIEQEIIRTGYTFPINNDGYFNYIFINKNKLPQLIEDMDKFDEMIFLEDDTIDISIHLGAEYYLKLIYTVSNYKITSISFSFLDDVFLEIDSNKNVNSHSLDLRNINAHLKLDKSSTIKKWNNHENDEIIANNDLYSIYEVFFGFQYLNAILIFEKNCNQEYELGEAPSLKKLFSDNSHNKKELTFTIGGYDNNSSGFYRFTIGTLLYTGQLYLVNYEINIKGNDILTCEDINVKYNDYISKADYVKNYVFLNGEHVNIANCEVYSIYYNTMKHFPGQYEVTVEYLKDNKLLVAKGIIYTADDETPPEILGDNEITDNISNRRNIIEYLKGYKAIDEVDGDVSYNIRVNNLNDFDNENPKPGNYKFLITAKDNSNHEGKLYVLYHLIDDRTPENNGNITPITSTTNDDIPRSNVVTSNIPTSIQVTSNIPTSNIEEASISKSTENTELIINDKGENDIEFIIKTDTNKILSKDDIKDKLVFYGLLPSDYDGNINSEYFDKENEVGEYLITVSNNDDTHYYMIQVSNNNSSIKKEEEKKDDNSLMITFGIIISIVAIVLIVIIVLINKKKLNN